MKLSKYLALCLFGIFFIFILLLIWGESSSTNVTGTEEEQNLPEAVLRWKEKVTKEAVKNEIPEAVPYPLGIIMAESGGNYEKYPDIMQCSESQGRPLNSITDPDESIEVGVKYFADMWKGHQGYEVLNIMQVYDFGGGFLSHSGTGGNSEIAKIASDELADGIHEGGEKYWRWYGFNSRVEWCATFVSYVAEKANLKMERFAYCPTGINNFKTNNQWQGGGVEPKSGAIIFFDWDGDGVSDHVGIVEKFENNTVHTIEGNSGDIIARRSYEKNSSYSLGYGILN